MKKIGILVYDGSLTGGAERVAIAMAEELSSNCRVHLISLFSEKEDMLPRDKRYVTRVVHPQTVSITKNFFKLSGALREYLIQQEIDVLFSITAGVVTLAVWAARGKKIKTVFCEHSNLENKTYGKKHEMRQYVGAKFSDRVVALTARDRKNFIQKYKLNEKKVLSIPNWFVYDEEYESSYNIKSKRIISVGRLEYVKGYDLLIKVAERIYKNHPDWHWDIYGEGTKRKQIETWIEESNLQGFITLKGNVKDLAQRYKDYAIFVMTSYYEGFPLALLEAQVAKLPIVSFDCPTGPAEIVEDGKNGYLVPTYDVEALSHRLESLMANEEKRRKFSSNATMSLGRFSKETVLQKWNLLIDELMM